MSATITIPKISKCTNEEWIPEICTSIKGKWSHNLSIFGDYGILFCGYPNLQYPSQVGV